MNAKIGAAFTVTVMVMVSAAMAVTAISLLRSGDVLQIAIGVGLLVIVAVGCVLVAGEVRLGAASQRLARRLEAEGGLPSDPAGVTRLPSGRLEKADADAIFDTRRTQVEDSPRDWRAWWRLAAAYGEARDPARGRRALRQAVWLERVEQQGPRTSRHEESYGTLPRQRGEWWVPGVGDGPLPTVVLVHGGYWRESYDLHLQDAVAADLAGRGFLCWNVDYRPSSEPWPATLTDVASAYDHLLSGAYAARVDPARIAVVGHSAGGHLALWLASRGRLPEGAPGEPTGAPAPALVVAQAPVAALLDGYRERLGGGAVQALLGGGPDTVPERYAAADPVALLPTGVPTVLVHAPADDTVPLSQSTTYARAAAAAGDDCRVVQSKGGHFEHLEPSADACDALREALARL